MALDLQHERQQAHALIDLLSAEKLGAVRNLLEVMIDTEESADMAAAAKESAR